MIKTRLDRNAILDNANAFDVAMAIGMDVVKRGSRYFIPCPGHQKRLGKPDLRATNAVLTEKGYHCFACNQHVGLVDMVMEFLNCNAGKALAIIADTCGGASAYRNKAGDTSVVKMPLSTEDLKLIGLLGANNNASAKKLVNVSVEEPTYLDENRYCQKEGNMYFIYEKVEGWNIQRLFRQNEEKFNRVVAFQAKDAMRKYEKAINAFCNRGAPKAGIVFDLFNEDDGVDSKVFIGLRNAYQKKYWRCKEIMEEFMKKTEKRPVR